LHSRQSGVNKKQRTIIGDSGSAQETKEVFLKLFESSIVENNISKSIQRYQFAQAKQKLDLTVALGCWLCPSFLILNTSPIAGYNNKLLKATDNMKLGVHNINEDIIPVAKHNLCPSKINLLPRPPPPQEKEEKSLSKEKPSPPTWKKHEANKAALIIVSAAAAWFLFR